MFLCSKCHAKERCTDFHFVRAYGRCEDCGKTDDCVDCKFYRHRPVQRTTKKKEGA